MILIIALQARSQIDRRKNPWQAQKWSMGSGTRPCSAVITAKCLQDMLPLSYMCMLYSLMWLLTSGWSTTLSHLVKGTSLLQAVDPRSVGVGTDF